MQERGWFENQLPTSRKQSSYHTLSMAIGLVSLTTSRRRFLTLTSGTAPFPTGFPEDPTPEATLDAPEKKESAKNRGGSWHSY
jgi:hypothetical protein